MASSSKDTAKEKPSTKACSISIEDIMECSSIAFSIIENVDPSTSFCNSSSKGECII